MGGAISGSPSLPCFLGSCGRNSPAALAGAHTRSKGGRRARRNEPPPQTVCGPRHGLRVAVVMAPPGTLTGARPQREPARPSLASLPAAAPAACRPPFDPAALAPGILHLGCGAFHRAHQAFLTQKAIEAQLGGRPGPPPPWGIV